MPTSKISSSSSVLGTHRDFAEVAIDRLKEHRKSMCNLPRAIDSKKLKVNNKMMKLMKSQSFVDKDPKGNIIFRS
jgi:hypothetical protein